MSRQLKGALMAAGGGVCWGISGTMGQYLFTHEAMQTTWLIPIRLGLAGLILFVYWLVKDRRLLFAPWRQRGSAVMLVLYGVFGISLGHGQADIGPFHSTSLLLSSSFRQRRREKFCHLYSTRFCARMQAPWQNRRRWYNVCTD